MSWQKDSKDYVPFVEEGVAESPLAEDLPQARRWACGAVGLLALAAMVLGTRHALSPADMSKAVSLQEDYKEALRTQAGEGSFYPAEESTYSTPVSGPWESSDYNAMPSDLQGTEWSEPSGTDSTAYLDEAYPEYTHATHATHVVHHFGGVHSSVITGKYVVDEANCDSGEEKWDITKRAFCCKSAGKGCPKSFSCKTSSVNQPVLWEKERRDWCCLNAQVGCPSYKAPYSCKAETLKSPSSWSPGKKEYCCEHFAVGCHKEPAKAFDCKADVEVTLWSDMKKAWCCHKEQVGCLSSGHQKYDCTELDTEKSWSSKKKAWCCAKAGKACEKHFDCKKDEEDHWSSDEREFCCASGRCGPKFDCEAGYSHWEALWTSTKQEWCCSSYGRGCPSNDAYDCSHSAHVHTWSESKIMWCCQHRRVACGAKRPFDCMAGYSRWQHGWSSKKKSYCCKTFQLGCASGDVATGDVFDCTAGFQNRRHGWSQAKKAWCCESHKIGCEMEPVHHVHHVHHVHTIHFSPMSIQSFNSAGSTQVDAEDCFTGAEYSEHWSSKKSQFCCKKYNIACPTAHFL